MPQQHPGIKNGTSNFNISDDPYSQNLGGETARDGMASARGEQGNLSQRNGNRGMHVKSKSVASLQALNSARHAPKEIVPLSTSMSQHRLLTNRSARDINIVPLSSSRIMKLPSKQTLNEIERYGQTLRSMKATAS